MHFEHAPAGSYRDVASGHVLHSAPGHPGFPARLALELFARAREVAGVDRVRLWDPMSGVGGTVTAIALLRPDLVAAVTVSDVDEDAVGIARRNLALLDVDGLVERRRQLAASGAAAERLASADRLIARLRVCPPITTRAAVVDVTDTAALSAARPDEVDVAILDVPYGTQTAWRTAVPATDPAELVAATVEGLRGVLPAHAVVVVSADDRAAFRLAPAAHRAFKHGKRTIKLHRR